MPPRTYTAHAGADGLFVLQGQDGLVAQANTFLAVATRRGFSPRTVRAYAYDLVVFFRWLESTEVKLTDVDESALLEYIGEQLQRGAKPRSINRRLSTCRLFIRHVSGKEPERRIASGFYRGRGRDRNLGLHALRPRRRVALRVKVPRTLIEPLTRSQVRQYLRGVRRYRDLSIVYLMLLCGLRSLEVLLLQLDDVSLDELRLRVRGKGGKERALPFPELLRRLLARYIDLERPETKSERLFVVLKGAQRGEPMTSAGLRSLFRYRRRVTELHNANAHRFRHTFGTDMARAGVRLPTLQRMMGHAQAETTLQYINLAMTDIAAEYQRASSVIQHRYRAAR
jgi:site-specific recombinase XerD